MDKVKCPRNDANPAEKREIQGKVRAHHEMLNGRLKNWGILSQVFCHILRHGDVFRAWCAAVTQLTIENRLKSNIVISSIISRYIN